MSTLLQGIGAFLRAIVPAALGLNPVAATALGTMIFICTVAGFYKGLSAAYDKHESLQESFSREVTRVSPESQNITSLGSASNAGAGSAYSTERLQGNVNANFNVKPGPFKLVMVEVTKTYPNGTQVKESYDGSQTSFTLDINEAGFNSQSTLDVTVPSLVYDDDAPFTLKAEGRGLWNLKNDPSPFVGLNLAAGVILYREQKTINGDGSRALGRGTEQLSVSAGATTTFGNEAYVGKWAVDGVQHRKIKAGLFTDVTQKSGTIEVEFIYRDQRN